MVFSFIAGRDSESYKLVHNINQAASFSRGPNDPQSIRATFYSLTFGAAASRQRD
jgi:hypothetical protein